MAPVVLNVILKHHHAYNNHYPDWVGVGARISSIPAWPAFSGGTIRQRTRASFLEFPVNVCPPVERPHRHRLGPAPTSHPHELIVGIIGPGHVGQAFIHQVRAAKALLEQSRGLNLHLAAVLGRHKMWFAGDDPALNTQPGSTQIWRPSDLGAFVEHVQASGAPAVLVDCTASDTFPDHYAHWLSSGLHVITPNKRAGSGSLPRWQAIQTAARHHGTRFRYEATVGAGLPVVQTLRDLLDTGDELLGVQGMLSGTLAWLCHHHHGDRPFSTLVHEARALGYTEPDPREDLSGQDVARKLVILAREAGWALSMKDVQVESLVPPSLAAVSVLEFIEHLSELDAPMAARQAEARAKGGVLRHVASLDARGHARVRLEVIPVHHAFANARETDNVIQFRTRRYADNPLVIQGPGAGPEVTAAGIFSDLLRLTEHHPVRSEPWKDAGVPSLHRLE